MKLITDGTYWSIRRGWLSKEYFDFKCPGYWWNTDCKFLNDCWTDYQTARMWYARLKA